MLSSILPFIGGIGFIRNRLVVTFPSCSSEILHHYPYFKTSMMDGAHHIITLPFVVGNPQSRPTPNEIANKQRQISLTPHEHPNMTPQQSTILMMWVLQDLKKTKGAD
jgi:hypothetical protein